jgi:hypothetical protein
MDYNKDTFFWAGLCLEIRAAIHQDEDYITFQSRPNAGVEVERTLHLNVEYMEAFKFTPKGQAMEKSIKNKGKGKAHHNCGKGGSLRGVLQCLCSSFRSQCHGCDHNGHGRVGGQNQEGNRSGAQSTGMSRYTGACKLCGKFGH